jgi:3-oxoacyl-[acyl-carrier protein] reductase
MSDFLLELGTNPTARKVIKTLGLPVPMPQALRRAKGPWQERPLHDEDIVFAAAPGGAATEVVARTLAMAGAWPHLVGDAALREAFIAPGEAYGRPPKRLDLEEIPERLRARGLVFDATGIETTEGLRALYDFFHPLMRRIAPCGRVIVIGRPPSSMKTPTAAASQAALDGFVRSVAKEVGKRGSTAQLVMVDRQAESRLEGVLRFVLSPRAAFISGQPLRVSKKVKAEPEISFVQPLEGKVALVTGAARGIGAATARLLAEEGAHVVVLDRPDDDALASQVARDIGGTVLLADVSDPEAPEKIATTLEEKFEGVDIVVHNAGVTRDKTLANMKPERWDQTLDINLAAVERITDRLLEGTLHDGGRIILLSSIAGIAGNMGQTNYAASKAGIVGYTKALATDVAKRGITVNAIAPGFIETRLTAAIPVMIREVARRMSNLGQGGLPRDIGDAVTFLASPGAVGLTGNVLRVCGGSLVGA